VIGIVFTSVVAASPEAVWAHATTMRGVNDELRPLVRMTAPRHGTIEDLPLGEVGFRSVLLAGGLVPFDVHFLRLEERSAGRFLERSHSLLQRRWEHERVVEPEPGGGTRVTDRLRIEPRLPGSAWLVRRMVAATFHHRHRRLARRFGGVAG
jgi:ligand-binding SRPBCC domain-containing protein